MTLSFDAHKSACEYMGEENPNMVAWMEGPYIGAKRVAFVEAHKTHAEALESGDSDTIDSAWKVYCDAQNAWVSAYATGE